MIAYAIDHRHAPAPGAPTILAFDRSHHAGPGLEDVSRCHALALDDAQRDLLRQIARGRSHGFTTREADIADELGQIDLVTIGARWHRLATTEGYRAVGLRRRIPSPGRHRVARKAVRRG